MPNESGLEPVVWGCDQSLLEAKLLGLDLEADSLFKYSEKICLVQITDGEKCVLVDPFEGDLTAVSYTHLTLPTICSV